MSDRIAGMPAEDLLRIALAAVRFPAAIGLGERFAPADLQRIAERFPGFLAAHLDRFGVLGGAPAIAGFAAALGAWARDGAGQGAGLGALAQRLALRPEAGALLAAALPALAELRPRDLPAGLAAPGPGGFSLLFRLLAYAIRLRRPDMLAVVPPEPLAMVDWVIVFGLAEHGAWHLLPIPDRRLLLTGDEARLPLFLRAVARFRPDLAALADRPFLLRDWFRRHAAAEYGIRLETPGAPEARPGLLTVIGPWRQVLGIADDCFSACRALLEAGRPFEVVSTHPARWIEADPDKLALLGGLAAPAPRGERALFCDTLFEAVVWALRHWRHFEGFHRTDLFTPWELPGLPPGWRLAAGMFDTVMTPAGFVQQAFAGTAAGRVLRLTSSVEVAGRPAPAARLLLRRKLPLPPRARLVLTVFDFSSHLSRKNPEAAIAAFAAVRRQVKGAVLVVKTTRGRRRRGEARRLAAKLRHLPGALWIDGAWDNAALEALIQRADALVSLHRAEGFGRNIAKALLLGTKAVVTDWSGNTDMRAEPGYFGVRSRLVKLRPGDYVLGQGQRWAEPEARHAARQLRAALGPQVPRPGRAACRFSRQRFGRRLVRILGEG
ncbi:glycosyltransferase [Siccirubricoccus phaeus]|uniref:glycosyltransferase n=1 Tax=Siccirubricoccus phaeus TaxID=2595053 RepID=UPI0011F141B6|nr:glycosyltransferase [Siccirubricoccus phaeus]